MDFLLGILIGVALCLVYGNYLLRQKKKEEIDKHNRAVMKNVISAFDEMSQWNGFVRKEPENQLPLLRQLQDAVKRDDFEEAARLRDLINKK